MICPRCASNQNDDVRFCTLCGANLTAVRLAIDARETDQQFSWNKTWVAEMFLSHEEQKKRKAALERERGITPEMKRFTEIKAGVIVSSVGLAVAIFLYFLMQGIILGGGVTHGAAEILSRIWIAGVIPFVIGLALITNGVVVSKRLIEISKRGGPKSTGGESDPQLKAADTNDFSSSPFSVTEHETRLFNNSDQKS